MKLIEKEVRLRELVEQGNKGNQSDRDAVEALMLYRQIMQHRFGALFEGIDLKPSKSHLAAILKDKKARF